MFKFLKVGKEVIDISIYSMLKKSTTRMVLDLKSLKKIEGVPCYKAKIVHSNDPTLTEFIGKDVNVPLDVFNDIRESVLHEVPSGNGYAMLWFCHGFFELDEIRKMVIKYVPEYSKNALQILLIDLDLNVQSVYTPNINSDVIDFYTIETSVESKLPEKFKVNKIDLPSEKYMLCKVYVKPIPVEVYCGKFIIHEELKMGDIPFCKFVRGLERNDVKNLLAGVGAVYALQALSQIYPDVKYDVSEIVDKIKRPLIALRDQIITLEEINRKLVKEIAAVLAKAELTDIRLISTFREIAEEYGIDIIHLSRIRQELLRKE